MHHAFAPRSRLLRIALAWPATALVLSTQVLAQPASLAPVVISGARVEQKLDEALAPVTVLTRADLERGQATDLADVLGRQTGLQFVRSGGPGSQTSVFARGAGSGQLLVLIDGMRLNTATGGFAALGGISVDTIDRIEIVRGNLSSLYGSEAVGGVIQIFTRGATQGNEVVVRAEAGTGSTAGGSLSASRAFGQTRLSATAAARRSEPFSAIDTAQIVPGPFAPGANPDLDGNRQRSGVVRVQHRFSDATSVGLSAWAQRNRTDFDSTADGPTATQSEEARTDAWRLQARHALTEVWTLRLQAGETSERSTNRSSEPFSFNNGTFSARNREAQAELDARLADTVTAQLGAEYLDQRGGSTGYDPTFSNSYTRFTRNATSLRFGVTGRTQGEGRHQVQINVRHDDYSDVGSADTWLVAYGYALTPRLRATLQASTAFRAPSFNDLYYPFYGNPALKPERARSEEAGLRYANAEQGARAALSLYRSRTRDLVQYNAATFQAENIARARVEGVELSAALRRGAWQVEGNANWLRTEDEATGLRLVRRAPRSFNVGLFHDSGTLRVGGEASWVAARDDFDVNTFTRKALPAYTLLRAVAQWRVTSALSLTLRAENLLDEKYTLVDGYNTWGRAFFGGLQWRM
jgi:vitamin B12 transporter